MRNLEKAFRNRAFDYDKLIKYGFKKKDEKYIYHSKIYNEQFEMIVEISSKCQNSKLINDCTVHSVFKERQSKEVIDNSYSLSLTKK